MPDMDSNRRRVDALRQEIAELSDVIGRIDTPSSYGHEKQEKLETLRTLRAQRERELQDLQAQIAGRR